MLTWAIAYADTHSKKFSFSGVAYLTAMVLDTIILTSIGW